MRRENRFSNANDTRKKAKFEKATEKAGVENDWSNYWKNLESRRPPGSMIFNKEFLSLIRERDRVLDIGCGNGRTSRELASATRSTVVGVDINEEAIGVAEEINRNIDRPVEYHVMDARKMNFPRDSFDIATLVGVLGGVHKELRIQIVREAVRVLKKGGLVYIAELAMKHGDPERDEQYRRDATLTGEMGSRIVYYRGGDTIAFIAKHFEEDELVDILRQGGMRNIEVRKELIVKETLGSTQTEEREQLSLWGTKV